MESEPNWEKWRHMDAALLWKLVALLARCDPDSISTEQPFRSSPIFHTGGARFRELLQIAESGVIAGTLRCHGIQVQWPARNTILMSEFLRWAQSKGLPIPPELKPPEPTGTAPASQATSRRIESYKELMPFCEARGLKFGSERAAHEFLKRAGIKPVNGDSKQGRRVVWDAAEVERAIQQDKNRTG
jgi:hypothetical protein